MPHHSESRDPTTVKTASPAAVPALRIAGLYKSYGTVEVLHGVDLNVSAGERVALMGPSGSGKSTLLNCICGIEPLGQGEISVAGAPLSQMGKVDCERLRRESIGYVFQSFHLLPTFTALENIELPGQLIGMTKEVRRERAQALLEQVGLAHRGKHRPDALSGGERQRVALARAVMNRPKLLLADEPTGSLDTKIGEQVLDLLAEVSDTFGLALLLVTHNRACTRICDRVVAMKDSRMVAGAS